MLARCEFDDTGRIALIDCTKSHPARVMARHAKAAKIRSHYRTTSLRIAAVVRA